MSTRISAIPERTLIHVRLRNAGPDPRNAIIENNKIHLYLKRNMIVKAPASEKKRAKTKTRFTMNINIEECHDPSHRTRDMLRKKKVGIPNKKANMCNIAANMLYPTFVELPYMDSP